MKQWFRRACAPRAQRRASSLVAGLVALTWVVCAAAKGDAVNLHDGSDGKDWPAFGRSYGEQHYSPLKQINTKTVKRLGLAWSLDLGPGASATVPVAVDGVLYFATQLGVVHAVDAVRGKLLWRHDPKAYEVAGPRMRQGWGIRGVGYWDGKVYTGTTDGRLLALDAKSGRLVWSVQTLLPGDLRYITGAPRLFDGKVVIGHGGADSANTRGYITTYDARSGQQLWRFHTVPGNPADGFESAAMEKAAKTWAGEWWKHGGGGTAWNAFTYDAETDTLFVGTGNGAPWNHKVRSAGQGDNLYLCSIVALDAKTGAYKWHYQQTPGETWDYNAAQDMHLAELVIDGKPRKVLMQAPKNGFLYVLDRLTGELISAEKIVKVTWASRIDKASGRPVETAGARFENGPSIEVWPSPAGAHGWMPSAYSPKAGLMFIPAMESRVVYSDTGIDTRKWQRLPGNAYDFGQYAAAGTKPDPLDGTGWLLAVDPATQTTRWKLQNRVMWNGGLMATAGDLVFQGQSTGEFSAYAADSGKLLWQFDAQVSVLGAPISYAVKGRQYVTVISGFGSAASSFGQGLPFTLDARTQPRRVLTFALDGKSRLPEAQPVMRELPDDPDFQPDPELLLQGAMTFNSYCHLCHGIEAVSAGFAPDLRYSTLPLSFEAFDRVVRGGALLARGMPRYEEFDARLIEATRHYIRSRAAAEKRAQRGVMSVN